jgi:hypothetical protein
LAEQTVDARAARMVCGKACCWAGKTGVPLVGKWDDQRVCHLDAMSAASWAAYLAGKWDGKTGEHLVVRWADLWDDWTDVKSAVVTAHLWVVELA